MLSDAVVGCVAHGFSAFFPVVPCPGVSGLGEGLGGPSWLVPHPVPPVWPSLIEVPQWFVYFQKLFEGLGGLQRQCPAP